MLKYAMMTSMSFVHPKPRSHSIVLRGGIALVIAVMIGLVLGYFVFANSNYIANGTTALGIDIGNMTRTAALTKLENNWRTQSVQLVAGEQQFTVPLIELGIEIDAQTVVREAYKEGRGSFLAPFRLLWTKKREIVPKYVVNREVATARLAALSADINATPQPASLVKENGVVSVRAGQPGQQLDTAATVAIWETNWRTAVKSGSFELVTNEIASPTNDLAPLAAQANAILNRPIQLTTYDPLTDAASEIVVSQAEWANWLDFSADENTLDLRVDDNRVGEFINAQFNDFRYIALADVTSAVVSGQESAELQIRHGERIHVVQSGETLSSIGRRYGMPYPWLQASNPDVDQLRIGQEIIIPSPDDLIPLPVVRGKRLVVSISDQHLWAYQNGQLIWDYPISTGIADSPTSPGVFQIQTHEINAYANSWDLHMPYFMGIYRPAPNIDFMNGFHGFPTRDGTNLLWTNSLGSPATYGCVLVGNNVAEQLYSWAEEGVIVEVLP